MQGALTQVWAWMNRPLPLPGNLAIHPLGIGEFLLILIFLWWGDGLTRPGNTRAQYNWALAETLERAGIEIPRPRQEVVLAGAGPMVAHQGEATSSSASST